MLVEIGSTIVMGGVLLFSEIYKRGTGDDRRKIERICLNSNLFIKENNIVKSIRLHRKTRTEKYTEYVFQIPLGLSFEDFSRKKHVLEDGLNNKKSMFSLTLEDIKQIKIDRRIIPSIQKLIQQKANIHKEVEMEFDGMMKIRVFSKGMPTNVMFNSAMWEKCQGWEIPLGQTRQGFITHDIGRGHVTLAGATRKGKTVLLKLIITTLIHRRPKQTKLTLIDLKGGLAFSRFKNAASVQTVARNAEETLEALNLIKEEMLERQRLFDERGYEDAKEAGIHEKHFIVVDEAANLSPNIIKDKTEKKIAEKCDAILSLIARIGAGLNYHLIYCSQYPTAEVMNNQIKQNCDTVISYKLRDAIASRVVLGESGAENLPIAGRAIYKTPDGVRNVQTPFIDNEIIEEYMKPHIIIKERKDDRCEQIDQEAAEGRNDIAELKITPLSD